MEFHPIDITSAEFKRDPFPTFAKLRGLGPLVPADLPWVGKCWLTATFEVADTVLRDGATFVVDPRNAGRATHVGSRWWMPRVFDALKDHMLGKDDPDHRRLRGLVASAFHRQQIEAMRTGVADLVARQLDQLAAAAEGNGTVDFVQHVARPLPLAVTWSLLGLPEEDCPSFRQWVNYNDVRGPRDMLRVFPGLRKLARYLERHFEACRRHPRPGMISALVHAEQEGDRLDRHELLASAFLLMIAGYENVVHLLSGGVATLLGHPDQKAALEADWSRGTSVIDEIMRYVSSLQMAKPRYAARDTELFGRRLGRGDVILVLLAAANADPAVFDHPETFDIGRPPERHLGFGSGVHACLGQALARLEAELVFRAIFSRFPALAMGVPLQELEWSRTFGMRFLPTLPLRLS